MDALRGMYGRGASLCWVSLERGIDDRAGHERFPKNQPGGGKNKGLALDSGTAALGEGTVPARAAKLLDWSISHSDTRSEVVR